MLTQLLGSIVKSKGAKVGAASLTGGTILALVFFLNADLKSDLHAQEVRQKEYVQLVVAPLEIEIQNMKTNIDNTNTKVNAIYKYLIKK